MCIYVIMSDHIHKGHGKSLLLYHFVCPNKYKGKVLSDEVSETLKEICLGIEKRCEIHFLKIGLDEGHVHFLVQSASCNAPKKIIGAA